MNSYPDPSSVSPLPVALRYGLIGGLISIVLSLLTFMVMPGMAEGSMITFGIMGIVVMLIGIAVFIWVIRTGVLKHRNEELGGAITFGRAFIVSFLIIVVMVAVSSAFSYLYTSFIAPEYYNDMADAIMTSMENMGAPQDQIDQTVERMRAGSGRQIIQGLITNLVIGVIVALIAAAVLKKDPQYDE